MSEYGLHISWSTFSCIQTEYEYLLCKSPYLVHITRIRTKKTPCLETFHAVNKRHLHCSVTVATLWQCSEIPYYIIYWHCRKRKFSIMDFFSKCDQIRSLLRIWSYLLKKSLMENFFFVCAVHYFRTMDA